MISLSAYGIPTGINIKQTLADVINKNSSCGFKASQIDHGEVSCCSIADGHVSTEMLGL